MPLKYKAKIEFPTIKANPRFEFWNDSNEFDEEDYEDELKNFVATPSNGNSYVFKITSLQPQKAKWLSGVLLLKTEKPDVKISYSIRSSNSDGSVIGILS